MKIVITIGIPGCGKSTEAAKLGEEFVEANRDEARLQLTGSYDNFSMENDVTYLVHKTIGNAFRAGKSVIVSDTNTVPKFRKQLIEFVRKVGYTDIEAWIFNVDVDTCLKRNQTRTKPVPPDIIQKMANRMLSNLPTTDEGFTKIIIIEQTGAKALYRVDAS